MKLNIAPFTMWSLKSIPCVEVVVNIDHKNRYDSRFFKNDVKLKLEKLKHDQHVFVEQVKWTPSRLKNDVKLKLEELKYDQYIDGILGRVDPWT